jgi:plastocyanin
MNGAFEVRDDAPQPPGGAGGQPGGGSAVQQEVTATDFAFDKKELEAAPNTAVKFTMKNAGQAPHSLVFLDARGGKELASGSTGTTTNGGQSSTVSFTTPGAGTYFFQCGIHPGQMNGTFTVKAAGGAQPTSAATSTTAAPAAVTLDVVATEFQFDKKELRVQAGAKVTVNLKHGGAAVPRHSIQFLDAKGGKELAPGSTGKVINSGQTDTLTFTAPAAGTYHYECAIHPGQMTGVLTVTGAAAGATSVPTLESVRTAVAQNSRLVSGSKAQVVTAVSVFAEPSGTARIVTALSVGTRVTVVTGTPAGSTFVITEGLIWFRVLVDGTQTVGWVPEVRTDNSIRYLERVP